MEKISLHGISFDDFVFFPLLGRIREMILNFSAEFEFGRCYCLNSKLTQGGWGISWIIAGKNKEKGGSITIDGHEISIKERLFLTQCVGMDSNDHPILIKQTVKRQIESGLRKTNFKNGKSAIEIAEKFKLEPRKIDRTIDHISAMRFKASLAIGYSSDKKIFCFPWMQPNSIQDFQDIWLKDLLLILKKEKSLILIPTEFNLKIKDIFDDVTDIGK